LSKMKSGPLGELIERKDPSTKKKGLQRNTGKTKRSKREEKKGNKRPIRGCDPRRTAQKRRLGHKKGGGRGDVDGRTPVKEGRNTIYAD